MPVLLGAGILITSTWLQTRGLIRSGQLEQYSFLQAIHIYLSEFSKSLSFSQLRPENVQNVIRERIDMTDLLAQQAVYQPNYEPYARGATLQRVLVAIVPRAIWPGKPEIAGGSEFVAQFTGITRPEDDTTSIGLPYQFELYANGGPWLVVIGLFFIGYVSGTLESRPLPPNPGSGTDITQADTLRTLANGAAQNRSPFIGLVAVRKLCAVSQDF
jgi:hypothetical protein